MSLRSGELGNPLRHPWLLLWGEFADPEASPCRVVVDSGGDRADQRNRGRGARPARPGHQRLDAGERMLQCHIVLTGIVAEPLQELCDGPIGVDWTIA